MVINFTHQYCLGGGGVHWHALRRILDWSHRRSVWFGVKNYLKDAGNESITLLLLLLFKLYLKTISNTQQNFPCAYKVVTDSFNSKRSAEI